MFLDKKIVDLNEFMTQLHQKIKMGDESGAVLAFFECFLLNALLKQVRLQVNSDWDGRVNAGDFDRIYPMAASLLFEAATRNASEAHPDIYQEATVVSRFFCELLNETFECTEDDVFNPITILSYTQQMVEAGLANVTEGPDGEKLVTLTDKGKSMASLVTDTFLALKGY